ncbi:Uncharacterized protein Fot_56476 [Forsythia ovata]|uniref:Secreted protein n=1 Tax=Forsythia ovata TaxID=205694 RepID=A0ABD1NZN8_9LAMI
MDRLNIPLGSLVLTLLCGIHSRSALGITSSSGWNSSQNPTTSPTSLPPTLSRTSIETEWFHRKANCLLAGSCMSGNVHVRLREKGGGQKWPCCTSLSSSMGSALFFLGEYANMILMRCGALHLTFVGLPFSGACVPAFLCNKPLRPKTSGRWSRGAFGKG